MDMKTHYIDMVADINESDLHINRDRNVFMLRFRKYIVQ